MIKTYICPECGKESTADEWNEATMGHYETYDIGLIDDEDSKGMCDFMCPSCLNIIAGKYIKEGERE
jgi:uncharacterized protein YlaI